MDGRPQPDKPRSRDRTRRRAHRNSPTASDYARFVHGRIPFYYGWIMLGVAVAMAMATMPGQTAVVALFNTSFRDALNLKLSELAGAYALGTILAALPLPLVGRAADRFGLRIVTGVVVVAFALALVFQSQASSLSMLAMGFFLMRFLGQGSLGLLAGHTTSMWFERRLGRAHAILAIGGFMAGSAIAPQPVAWLIAQLGWRYAMLALAAFVFFLVMPLVLTVFRDRPEQIGQHLDGDPVEHEKHDIANGGSPPPGDPAFTSRQALKTRAFWVLVPVMVANGLIGTALLFNMQAMLETAGLEGTEKQAALAIQSWPIATIVGTLIVGNLADRMRPNVLLPIGPVFLAISCLTCLIAVSGWIATPWIIPVMGAGLAAFGLGQSVSGGVGNPTIARYFGRTHHGAIRGIIQSIAVAGTGAGPFIAGVAFEWSGQSFIPILIIFAISCVPLAIMATTLRPPKRPAPTP